MLKSLLIYCAFIATCAVALPHFGYNYQRNVGGSGSGGSSSGMENKSFFNPSSPSSNTLSQPTSPQHQLKSEQTYGGDKYLPPAATTAAPIITKQFYLISAPEEEPEPQTKHFVLGRPQKNYRVVFIKAPTSENANVKLTAEYAPQEEKTVIYVLSRKANELNIGDIDTPAPTPPTRPEVFFIKYKTPEEAAAAQKEIQEQYDHLGGTSEFSDEGFAPIKSVIGSLDGLAADGGYDYRRVQSGANSPIKNFLQPARFYF